MTRQELFEKIYEYYGPQGPDDTAMEKAELQRKKWFADRMEDIYESFVDMIINPPPGSAFKHPSHLDSFEVGIWEIAGVIGKHGDPNRIINKLTTALENPFTRLNAIVVIGQLGSDAGLELFKPLINADHSEETWLYLIGAIGDIGKKHGSPLLLEIESKVSKKYPGLIEHIRNAENIINRIAG